MESSKKWSAVLHFFAVYIPCGYVKKYVLVQRKRDEKLITDVYHKIVILLDKY